MKNFFQRQTPLCIAMWDYSWLQCSHPGGSFSDLARCVEEAALRGYNTLRVDVFPHFYHQREHRFASAGRERRIRTWGDVLLADGYVVNVRERVAELANLCRRHGIWLGLDTWQSFNVLPNEMIPAAREELVCRQWAQAWVDALPAMRDDGVLERAVWLAPLNEVPLFLGTRLASVKVSDPEVRHEGQTKFRADLPELDVTFRRINHWLGEAIHDALCKDGIPLSYSALGAENYSDRVTEIYDVVDSHFMPDMWLEDADRSALEKAGPGASRFSLHHQQDPWDLTLFGAAWDRAARRHHGRMLQLAADYADAVIARTTLPNGKQLQAVVTEAYGPCNHPDHPEVDWTDYKNWNADAARIFASRPFAGLTLSNHAEPLFSLWQDVDWHRRGNAYIRAAI